MVELYVRTFLILTNLQIEIDGKEVIIERLMRGSILNYRTFFMEEPALVFARATKNVTVLEITFPRMSQFFKDSDIFERKLLAH